MVQRLNDLLNQFFSEWSSEKITKYLHNFYNHSKNIGAVKQFMVSLKQYSEEKFEQTKENLSKSYPEEYECLKSTLESI